MAENEGVQFCLGGYYKAVAEEGRQGEVTKAVVTAILPSSAIVLSPECSAQRYKPDLPSE